MRKEQILSADFETTTLLQLDNESSVDYRERLSKGKPKVYSWAIAKRNEYQDYEIKDGTSMMSFMEYIQEIDMDTRMYFHNGSKFDLHFIIPYLTFYGFKQVIVNPDNLAGADNFDFETLHNDPDVILVDKLRKLKPKEYTLLIDGNHKILEMKIGLESSKRTKGETKYRVLRLLDSNLMFPSALKGYGKTLNKEYDTDFFTKLDIDGGYTRETLYKNYDEFLNDGNEREYLHKDVIILIEFLHLMAKTLPFRKWKITASATTFSIWKYDFYGKSLLDDEIFQGNIIEVELLNGFKNYRYKGGKKNISSKLLINRLVDKKLPVGWLDSYSITGFNSDFNFVGKAYQGGLTMANSKHAGIVKENVVYVDINSSYPTQMLKQDLPYGLPKIGDSNDKNTLKLINLDIDEVINETGIPFLATFSGDKTGKHYTKKISNQKYTITSVEFERFKKYYKGKYTHDVALRFLSVPGTELFGEFIDHFYALKSKPGVSQAEKIYAKLMLNGLYGKFGQDIHRVSKLYIDNHWESYETISKSKFYLPLATFITAYARMYLVDAIGDKYENVVLMDTDSLSIIVPESVFKGPYTRIKEYLEYNYQLTIDGSKIGAWDIEYMMSKVVSRRAKQYMLIDTDGNKIVKFAGLRLSKEQLDDLTFDDFILGKDGFEQLRPYRTPKGLFLETYKKSIRPIWEYDLNKDYWFKDEKTFLKR